jgi:transcriptional regulator with XRE-family HTH domain
MGERQETPGREWRAKVDFSASALRTAREERGLTQGQLAEVLGVDRVTIARWECGMRTPRGAALRLVELWLRGEV